MTLFPAANGHLTLDFDDAPEALWEAALGWLKAEGFRETGETVLGPGQSLFPSYVRWSVALLSGWDEWSGNYLLATCDDGDAFLTQLHAWLADLTGRTSRPLKPGHSMPGLSGKVDS